MYLGGLILIIDHVIMKMESCRNVVFHLRYVFSNNTYKIKYVYAVHTLRRFEVWNCVVRE